MKKTYYIIALLFAIISACEDIYNPEIEEQERVLVVDARIIHGQFDNQIKIYKSLGFNEKGTNYPEVSGAEILLIDNDNTEYKLSETTNGVFHVNFVLDTTKSYRLKINYEGEVYESEFEKVPDMPVMDSIYGFAEKKIFEQGGTNDVNDFLERPGVMLYTDITNEKEAKYYRFSARKTFQYVYYIENPVFGELTVFAWNTITSLESFNIAAPPEYSATIDIKKHPLYFLNERIGPEVGQPFVGWILFLHQYSISDKAYNFYKDVNNQLEAEGRLFDPLYVQARNNLKCTSNPEKLVLGNFEISRHKEYRFYVLFISEEMGYLIKPIPYFYDIPRKGESVEEQPDFWETPSKKYPND